MPDKLVLLVATRKGAWLFHADGERRRWRADGPHFLGHIFNHLVLDPRDRRTLLARRRACSAPRMAGSPGRRSR